MNKIVREHYPVEKLPEDLRRHFPGATSVTIEVVEENAAATHPLSHGEAIAMIRRTQEENARNGRSVSTEEAVRRVRELRDEWDD